jgi:hypothetical protein
MRKAEEIAAEVRLLEDAGAVRFFILSQDRIDSSKARNPNVPAPL